MNCKEYCRHQLLQQFLPLVGMQKQIQYFFFGFLSSAGGMVFDQMFGGE
jgi:hypothetical protein